MVPPLPAKLQPQQRCYRKRVRFPSADLSNVAHVDFVSKEDRPDYWYTAAEYGVIEREIKQTVRRLRKRAAAELKRENDNDMSMPTTTTTATITPMVTSSNKRQRQLSKSASASVGSESKYCDRGLEDFVHHYETKQLKNTICQVILAEQELQRARGIQDPVALMKVSMACTHLSRQQAMALGEQDAEEVLQLNQRDLCSSAQQEPYATSVAENDDACHFLFSHDMISICDDITRAADSHSSKGDEQRQVSPPMTLLSLCDAGAPTPASCSSSSSTISAPSSSIAPNLIPS